jgi:hypothetical protein
MEQPLHYRFKHVWLTNAGAIPKGEYSLKIETAPKNPSNILAPVSPCHFRFLFDPPSAGTQPPLAIRQHVTPACPPLAHHLGHHSTSAQVLSESPPPSLSSSPLLSLK